MARLKRLSATVFPFAVFALLALISWNRWIEPYVDSGRELIVPSRIAHGEALYRDVRYYYGPLAPYLAAAVETAAGRSFPARILLAAAIALAHLEGLRRLALRLLSPARASLATALAVAVCFFLRPGGCHLFPYSLDTALAVAAATWALTLPGGGGPVPGLWITTCIAAALLARPEIGIATALALAIASATEQAEAVGRRSLLLGSAAAFLPTAALYALVSRGTPLATLRTEGWLAFLAVPREFRNVYRSFSGIDRPGLRLAELALAGILVALAAAWLALAAYAAAVSRRKNPFLGGAVAAGGIFSFAALAVCLLLPPQSLEASLSLLPPLVRPLPVFVLGGALWRAGARVLRRRDTGIFRQVPDAALLIAALFAVRLLLAAGYVGPYSGFFLPLPLIVATAGVFDLADRVGSRPEFGPVLPRLVAGALVIFLGFRAVWLIRVYRNPGWSRVATAAGSLFVTEPVAGATRLCLEWLERTTPAGGTAVGFPEAGFLQYVLDRRNPLPQDQFFPGHLDAAAEEDAIARLRRRPPDLFLYVNVLTVGHGPVAFGRDYLQRLDAAARALSHRVASFGPGARTEERIGDPDFFIEIRLPDR
ncbi:MAG: hypothetical protein ACRD1P_10895 [Thermoanaerobaculia bacterium]